MSSTRRTAAPRKRPTSQVGSVGLAKGGFTESEPEKPRKDEEDGVLPELLNEIHDLLRSEHELEETDREALEEIIANSLKEALHAEEGGVVGVPNQEDWQGTMQLLQDAGSVSEQDANVLLRQLDAALATFHQEKVSAAVEFSRRFQGDGQEAALAWLREQLADQDTEEAQKIIPDRSQGPLSRNEVTKSKSRRLRGPPRT